MSEMLFKSETAPPCLPGQFALAWQTAQKGTLVGENRGRRVVRIELAGQLYYAKSFFQPKLGDLVRNFITAPCSRSQGEREFRVARRLQDAGLHPVEPVVYGQQTRFLLEHRSLFISIAVPGTTLGHHLRKDRQAAAEGWHPETEIALQLANLLRQLLACGIYLPDLSLEHILVPPTGPWRLLDLHNGRHCRRLGRARVGRMLGRLWAGARDTVPAGHAMIFAVRLLASFFCRAERRLILANAAGRGARWAKREKRKRPEEQIIAKST